MDEASWLGSFVKDRVWGLFDGLVFLSLWAMLLAALGRISRATVIARLALRTRVSAGVMFVMLLGLVALWFEIPPALVVVSSGVATIFFVVFALRGITRLGISNAFATTGEGISAERSLALVKSQLAFLGIGASKLTKSEEFSKMLERCKVAGGQVRFLLSDPGNKGLEKLAGQNNRNHQSYKSRVEDSIREIFHQGQKVGVKFEVRLYKIDTEKALSKFRLHFVDDRLCLLSHVVWNQNEGADNSQILINRVNGLGESTLYCAYMEFFEDLWEASTPIAEIQEVR